MSQSVLAPAKTPGVSANVIVGETEIVLLSVYTDTGNDVGPGPVLTLEKQDHNGNFITVATVGYGKALFHSNSQHMNLLAPGIFRVVRPDISAWPYNIGIELYRYDVVPPVGDYTFDAGTFLTDYSGLDSLSGGAFPDDLEDEYIGGSF